MRNSFFLGCILFSIGNRASPRYFLEYAVKMAQAVVCKLVADFQWAGIGVAQKRAGVADFQGGYIAD